MFAADNIRLRALEPEDLEWLYSVENDEELWQWGSSNVPYSRYTLKTYIAESLLNFDDLDSDEFV